MMWADRVTKETLPGESPTPTSAPTASIMDEKQHMVNYLMNTVMISEDVENLPQIVESAMEMNDYYGVVLPTTQQVQVGGMDQDRIIYKQSNPVDETDPLSDGGANVSVTNDPNQLHQMVPIEPFSLTVAEKKEASNGPMCTHRGLFPLVDDRTGEVTYTPMYLNAAMTGTIVSPSSVLRNSDIFYSCTQTMFKDGRQGSLRFESESGLSSLRIKLNKKDGLYYIPTPKYRISQDYSTVQTVTANLDSIPSDAAANKAVQPPVTAQQQIESELWAARLGHCGEHQLDLISKAADGVPKTFHYHPFRYIDFKEAARTRKQPSRKVAARLPEAGRGFFMDFAFLRASSKHFNKPNVKDDRIVQSFDGFNSHLVIVDEASSMTWVFLLQSKEPPTDLVVDFLKIHGLSDGVVRTDQGGELAKSEKFRDEVFRECGYVVEPTGSDGQSQNGSAEKMNDVLAVTTRALLYGAALPPQYWSVALIHAVYVHNRRVHSRTGITPYEGWYGRRPNLKYLRLFGSRVCVKKTGQRPAKLDKHNFTGIFLGYSATDQNIIYIDLNSGIVKNSHHATFDEAWYLFDTRPPAAQLLYDLGKVNEEVEITPPEVQQPAPTPPIDWHAQQKMPLKDIGEAMNLPLPLRWEADPNEYCHGAAAASISRDSYKDTALDASRYKALFQKYDISQQDVMQIYFSRDPYADEFSRTFDLKAFSSSSHPTAGLVFNQQNQRLILMDIHRSSHAARIRRWRSECKGAWIKSINGTTVTSINQAKQVFQQLIQDKAESCELILSHPEVKHGLSERGIPQVNLDQMNPRKSYLGPAVLPPIIKQASPPPLYDPEGDVLIDGLPQVNKLTRGKLMKEEDWVEWQKSEYQQLDQYEKQGMFGEVVKISEVIKQAEKEFGPRNGKLPIGVFRLVWTYAVKLAGDVKTRRKSRAAIDGSPRAGQAEIIGPTFANCADQTASRLFYAIAAAENKLLFGGDVSNAFAEAPGPEKHFYIQPDKAFKDWWVNHKKRPPLQDDEVVIGLKAFQGHPEAARAWDRHSDKFLKEIGFVPTTHEPCLYSGIFDGERVLFLRQVDDFAIAASNEQVANDILDKIDEFLTFPIKRLGLLKLFNGVDIDQTSEYIKISVVSYLTKIMEKYLDAETGFMSEPDQYPLAPQATPLPTRKRFIESFLSADGDRNKDGTPDMSYQRKMQKQLKISYRSAIGEIIWAMTTCRPDVSHAVVKAAQFSSCPHEIHYHGVRHILKYLNKTKDEGITFWRATKRTDLPDAPRPTIISDKRELFQDKRREFGPMELNAQADSDWAHCPKTRRSFTGVIVRMAGGTIAWKTRLQEAVALSSAEAELMAATDAGKMILYIRSILWDLGIPQLAATVIGEDNDACTAIGNAQKTTPRTRHMDIRYRALSDWIESDLMVLERVDTAVNTSDHLTKILGRILFHRHNDYLLGHVPPKYTQAYYELFHPMMQATTQDNINNSYETPHNVTDVGDKVVKSLIAQWNLLCHLVEI